MKVHWIMNDRLQLILSGETELETQMLKQMFNMPVIVSMQEKMRIGEIDLVDAAVITSSAVINKDK